MRRRLSHCEPGFGGGFHLGGGKRQRDSYGVPNQLGNVKLKDWVTTARESADDGAARYTVPAPTMGYATYGPQRVIGRVQRRNPRTSRVSDYVTMADWVSTMGDDPPPAAPPVTASKVTTFVQEHPVAVLGGAIAGGLLLAHFLDL